MNEILVENQLTFKDAPSPAESGSSEGSSSSTIRTLILNTNEQEDDEMLNMMDEILDSDDEEDPLANLSVIERERALIMADEADADLLTCVAPTRTKNEAVVRLIQQSRSYRRLKRLMLKSRAMHLWF